ncbi:hypothetical protein CIK76_05860 [Glutamicibacter sp. BW80]|nr:hypothetical protein CIK76_05860 [Glutamicibacter sp. BW80]
MASSSSIEDPYLTSPDGVLRNLVGADSYQALAEAEADLFHARVVQLRDHELVEQTRDAWEIRGLHRHLFQDVYDWAGEYRTINMRRGSGQFFAPSSHIPFLIDNVMSELANRNHLKDLEKEEFIDSLAKFYDELNHIHPFREGNGRMQRTYWSRIAFSAGWYLVWQPIQGNELNETSRIAREDLNLEPLRRALDKCVTAVPPVLRT